MIKNFFFALIFFGLPHVVWVPRKLGVDPEAIPLGVLNIVFLLSLCLYLLGRSQSHLLKNPFKSYFFFLVLVVIGVGIACVTNFDEKPLDILRTAKNELSLLLLYFIPLVCIKNEKDFLSFFIIFLLIDFIIGIEVLRSGVLAGSHFHDMKRGSGPFGQGWGWQGSDIAAGYIAQELLYFIAILFFREVKIIYKLLVGFMTFIISLGLFATYARGAFLAAIIGIIFIFFARGIKLKYFIGLVIVICILMTIFMPQSFRARISELEKGHLDESSIGRIYYYNSALRIIKDYPFGVGTGQMRSAMKQYTRGVSNLDDGKYVDPHNGFLYIACEYGVIGLMVFIVFLKQLLRTAKAIVNNDKNCPLIYRIYALGAYGMLGAFLVVNMFYANFFKELVMGTIAIHFGMLAYIKAKLDSNKASISVVSFVR